MSLFFNWICLSTNTQQNFKTSNRIRTIVSNFRFVVKKSQSEADYLVKHMSRIFLFLSMKRNYATLILLSPSIISYIWNYYIAWLQLFKFFLHFKLMMSGKENIFYFWLKILPHEIKRVTIICSLESRALSEWKWCRLKDAALLCCIYFTTWNK